MPSASEPSDMQSMQRERGRYVLERELSRGGMGVIYLARDRVTQRDVVYKRLLVAAPEQRALRVALFRREYEALARLPHPNIVEVYDYGEDEGAPYYVMERLGGDDLTRAAPLPMRAACRLLRDIASALALVHSRRLVHRDVSPNNVRLTADGTAKLLDFGALSAFGPSDQLVGTPGFMAPESFARMPLDQRSDLFSLGALAYWALTRRTPFAARSIDDFPEAFETPPTPPSAYVPELPRELTELVLSLLAIDPDARPHDASYVIDRLTSIAELAPEQDERRVAQSYLAHPPLCGRDEVLAQLTTTLDQACAGRGGNVLIEGEAGLGASALLAAAGQHAQLHGASVLRARGDGLGDSFRLARSLLDQLGVLFPDLNSDASSQSSLALRPPGGEQTLMDMVAAARRRTLVLEKAERTFLEASALGPLVLIVDDLHAADEESLALVTSLAQQTEARPLAIVASRLQEHDREVAPRTSQFAARAERMVLAPLDKLELGELVRAIFGDVPNGLKLAHWLHAQSGGNPATTLDLLRVLMQRGAVRYTLGTFHLPADLAQTLTGEAIESAVLARLGDLQGREQTVAVLLSLHEGALHSEAIVAASGLTLRDVQLSLDELTQRGNVERTEAGYQLLGSSLRAALERSVSAELRVSLHVALARARLADMNRDPWARYDASQHFLSAGRDDEALALLIGHAHDALSRQEAVYRAPLLESALAAARRTGRSPDECLSLLIPLAGAGFHASTQRYVEHVDLAVSTMADVLGMRLANRLQRFVGGLFALLIGMTYASIRIAVRRKRTGLGRPLVLLNVFVGAVCDAIALAAARCDTAAAQRYVELLEPFASLPKNSAGRCMREFALATVQLTSGHVDRASARYGAMIPVLPTVKELDAAQQRILRLGASNGRGLSEAAMGSAEALTLADEIADDPFFAAFADGIRFAFHALRGDRQNAEASRHRAELLALHRGISWTAEASLAQLAALSATLTENAIALVRAIADLERLGEAAPNLRIYAQICDAWLEHVRGRSERALSLFEPVIHGQEAAGLCMTLVNRALYATVLDALGQHERAEQICLEGIRDPSRTGERTPAMRTLTRTLAVAIAGLGRLDEAAELVQLQIAEALPVDNPLELGLSHRDRARIALLASDRTAFDVHFAQMERYYQRTHEPCLRRQQELLLASAQQLGLRSVLPPTRSLAPSAVDTLDSETYVEPTRQKA